MKPSLLFFNIVLGVAIPCILGSPTNQNGAIHARVTSNGLNYINQALQKMLAEKVRTLAIPSINGNKDRVTYSVTNIKVITFNLGPSSIVSSTNGIRWRLTLNEVQVRADWRFRYKRGFIKFGDDGHVTAKMKGLSFDVTFKPTVVNGRLAILPASVIPRNCAHVRDIDLRIGGSFWKWIYNWIANRFEDKLQATIPAKVCDEAGKALNKWSSQVFPNMQTSDIIDIQDHQFLADFGLVQPQFTTGLVNIRFLGDIFPQPKTFQAFPFSPSPMPSTASTKHVYLVISDFVFDSLLYSAKQAGLFKQSFTVSDIGSENVREILGELCQGLGLTCSDLKLTLDILDAPKFKLTKNSGTVLTIKNLQIVALGNINGETKDLVNVKVDATLTSIPRLSDDGRKLYFTFGPPQINFDVINPSLPQNQLQKVKRFVELVGADLGQTALNKVGSKGLALPNVKDKIDIIDRQLDVEDGALVLGANMKLNF